MNHSCEIVEDLLPLYIENLSSEKSRQLVEQHLSECTDCHHHYERVRCDYEQRLENLANEKQLEPLLSKLGKYQQKIKLFGVLSAMLMACIVTGAHVQFLVTFPFLIIIPFICRLYYDKSFPIIAASLPCALIGGILSEQGLSFIPFFVVVALLLSSVGVGAGVLCRQGRKQVHNWRKWAYIIPALTVLLLSSAAYFSFFGNPVGYVTTMMKSNHYVDQTYEQGTLTFKGVSYNFKDKRHYGQFEYLLHGVRQTAAIGFYAQGDVDDSYKYVLETAFGEERAADLRADFAAVIDFMPTTIVAIPDAELELTQDALDHRYYHLSYDLEKRNKAASLRRSEAKKLSYTISFGEFIDELNPMSKEQFLQQSLAIYHALQEQDSAFRRIEVKSLDNNERVQSVQFQPGATEEEVIASYGVES